MISMVGTHDVRLENFGNWFSAGNVACVLLKGPDHDVLKKADGGATLGKHADGTLGIVPDGDPASFCSVEGNFVFYNAGSGLGIYAFVNHLVNA